MAKKKKAEVVRHEYRNSEGESIFIEMLEHSRPPVVFDTDEDEYYLYSEEIDEPTNFGAIVKAHDAYDTEDNDEFWMKDMGMYADGTWVSEAGNTVQWGELRGVVLVQEGVTSYE